jgi:hypothetical protein
MCSDALLVWALCKAGGFSIAGALRHRVAKAKRIAEVMQGAENDIVNRRRKEAITAVRHWTERKIEERGITALAEPERSERWAQLRVAMHNRLDRELAPLVPRTFEPHHALPQKVLSRASLDRYLPLGLNALSDKLNRAGVMVR